VKSFSIYMELPVAYSPCAIPCFLEVLAYF